MPKFERPARPDRPVTEPAGLDAFVAKADITVLPEAPTPRPKGRTLPGSPMPVRFPADVKAALERLSRKERRSQQQILELIAFPAILAADGNG
jgi:hypothetical protein